MRIRPGAGRRHGARSRRPSRAARARASRRGASPGRPRRGSRGSLRENGRASEGLRRPRRDHSSPASSSMSCVMRTPRSTVGSYSKASCGVRFSLSCRATCACKTPAAAVSPARLRSRLGSDPSTLTNTRAWRRAAEVTTPVTVMKPILGALSSAIPTARTSFSASLTRRIRSGTERHQLPRPRAELPFLAVQIPLRLVQEPLGLTRLPGHARQGQPRALPQVVVVDLGDRGPEAVLQLRLRRPDEAPLALERARLGEVQLDREDSYVARGHRGPILPLRRSLSADELTRRDRAQERNGCSSPLAANELACVEPLVGDPVERERVLTLLGAHDPPKGDGGPGVGEHALEPSAETTGLLRALAARENRELVTPDAGKLVVAAERLAEQLRQGLQGGVALSMAGLVVDPLGPVHVPEHERERNSRGEPAVDRGLEGARVRQAGEEVPLGQSPEAIDELAVVTGEPADQHADAHAREKPEGGARGGHLV